MPAAMLRDPTTSPYMNACKAAAVEHRSSGKGKRGSSMPAPDEAEEPCIVCGAPVQHGLAYCSDACRHEDGDAPSPYLSPVLAANAVPALVPSRRSRDGGSTSSPPSSATSSPSKAAEHDSDIADIKELNLGPAAASFKRSVFNYSYGFDTAHAVARSPVKSTGMRKSTSNTGSVRSPLLAATLPTSSPTEVITFRRRHQPDSINAAKQSTAVGHPAAAAAVAHAARRRSSGNAGALSNVSRSEIVLPTYQTTSRPTTASSSSSFARVQPFSPVLAPTTQTTCARRGCPLSTSQSSSGPSALISALSPLTRRISEPHSPYASPRPVSPEAGDPFEQSFAGARSTSAVRLPTNATPREQLRRPSLSSTQTAPPVVSVGTATARPEDHAGFSGYLFNLHNREKKAATAPTSPMLKSHKHSSPHASPVLAGKAFSSHKKDSGYDAHDEQDSSSSRPVTSHSRKSSSSALAAQAAGEHLTSTSTLSSLSSRNNREAFKDKLATVFASSASSSDASSVQRKAVQKPTRFLFGRGHSAHSKVAAEDSKASGMAVNGERPSSESEEELRSRQRRQKAAGVMTEATADWRPKHNHSTSVGEGSQYVVSIRPSAVRKASKDRANEQDHVPPLVRRGTTESAIASSSSSSDEADHVPIENVLAKLREAEAPAEAERRGRGAERKVSINGMPRVPAVSPFTALQRMAQGTEVRQQVDSTEGRGRSRQRDSSISAATYRSVSPHRSRSRASSRGTRR